MKVGDLVKYGHTSQTSIGVVIRVSRHVKNSRMLCDGYNCEVQWTDGTTSTHSSRWLIRIEEIK